MIPMEWKFQGARVKNHFKFQAVSQNLWKNPRFLGMSMKKERESFGNPDLSRRL